MHPIRRSFLRSPRINAWRSQFSSKSFQVRWWTANCFDRVKGPFAWDIDGNRYIDYIGSWGPAICGHAHEVTTALQEAIEEYKLWSSMRLENKLAEMVINAVPSIEMVRFVNSGTEACMAVLRLMRAFTGRDKVIKFDGCYHGHADMFLVKAGSGVATLGLRILQEFHDQQLPTH